MKREPVHSEELNERELIGAGDDDDGITLGITLGSILALAAVVAIGVVIWVVFL